MSLQSGLNKVQTFLLHEVSGWKKIELSWLIIAISVIGIGSALTGEIALGIISAVAGITSAVLTGKGKPSAYIFGTISAATYTIITFLAGYYLSFILELTIILPLEFIGLYLWIKNMNGETHEVTKRQMKNLTRVLTALGIVAVAFLLGLLIQQISDDPMPFVDSFTTVTMAVAMFLSVMRYSEQWILWIIVDISGTILWLMTFLTTGTNGAMLILWSIYIANSTMMCIRWYKQTGRKKPEPPQYHSQ